VPARVILPLAKRTGSSLLMALAAGLSGGADSPRAQPANGSATARISATRHPRMGAAAGHGRWVRIGGSSSGWRDVPTGAGVSGDTRSADTLGGSAATGRDTRSV